MKAVKTTRTQLQPDDPGPDAWAREIKPHSATYFNTIMLQRTRREPTGPEVWRSDHFALERMARDLRRDTIAHLFYAGQTSVVAAAEWLGQRIGRGLRASAAALAPLGRWLERRIDDFDARAARWQREHREAFLAQSADVYELERRMRALERSFQRPL